MRTTTWPSKLASIKYKLGETHFIPFVSRTLAFLLGIPNCISHLKLRDNPFTFPNCHHFSVQEKLGIILECVCIMMNIHIYGMTFAGNCTAKSVAASKYSPVLWI